MESRKREPTDRAEAHTSASDARAAASTTRFTLANGLTVVVREDHFAPVVALQAWVNVGAADEHDREAGVAHVHEHMLFKGTARRGVGQIAAEVESSGGHINAFTSSDHTCYHLVLAGRHFATGLDVLADALQNSAFDAAELARELAVVLEEWKRAEDVPVSRAYTELFRQAFRRHPYGRPVIGWRRTIEGMRRPQVLDFFRRWYVPNNVVLVVVGDVEAATVRREVEAALGGWQARPLPARYRPSEPPLRGLRRAAIPMPVQEHHLVLGFPIPSAHHADSVPLDLLAYVLAGGESTRLVTELEAEKELANSVSAHAYTPPDPGLFLAVASLERRKLGDCARQLARALADTGRAPVTAAELDRARDNLESEFVYRRETMQGWARLLGYSQTVFGDPDYERRYLTALAAATREDLQRVAATYLRPDNMVAVLVGPDAGRLLPTKAALASAWRNGGPAATRRARPARGAGGHLHTRTLPNGVRLIVKEHRASPLVALRAATLGGLLLERRETNGISNFLAGLLARGTRHHTRETFGRAVDSLSGTLDGFSGRNSFGVRGQFLSRHLDEATDLFLELLCQPTLPEDEVEKRRRELLVQLSHRDDEPAQRAIELFYDAHFRRHPYRMPILGARPAIRRLSRTALTAYHARLLAPSRLVVSVVGDVEGPRLLERLAARLGELPAARALPRPGTEPPPRQLRRVSRRLAREQAHVVLGWRGSRITDADRVALRMIDAVLSRQGGRLFLEVRDRQGLAYTVSAFAAEGVDPGVFAVYTGCDPSRIDLAIAGVLGEIRRLRDEPVPAAELDEARTYLLGSYDISLQTNGAQADELLFNEIYGLGLDGGARYRAALGRVTPASVRAAARRYLSPETYTLAVVGPGTR